MLGNRNTRLSLALIGIVVGMVCLSFAAVLGALFIAAAISVCRDRTDRSAKRMFAYSILYLFLLFSLLIVDRAPGMAGGLTGGLV